MTPCYYCRDFRKEEIEITDDNPTFPFCNDREKEEYADKHHPIENGKTIKFMQQRLLELGKQQREKQKQLNLY